MNLELNFVLPHWLYWSVLALLPPAMMLMVRLSRRPGVAAEPSAEIFAHGEQALAGTPHNPVLRAIEGLSSFSGLFVAYWSLVAVFVYTYEVVARYAFNSPTNWAHEAMFLMFGMQYLISGAYCLKVDGHVRVDVLYSRFGPAVTAALDILTSIVFYLFVIVLTLTSWVFFAQSLSQEQFGFATGWANEVSFTEWGVQYYPVKAAMVLGGVLLLLQGTVRLFKDIQVFRAALARHTGARLPAWGMVITAGVLAALFVLEMVNVLVIGDDPERILFTLEGALSEVDIGSLTWLMAGALLVVLLAGLPLAFVTGGLGVLFIYLVGDQYMLNIIPARIFPLMTDYQLSAIPLFIFMAAMLEKAGLIEELFDVVYQWIGALRGGLAVATIIASTLLAAMVGVIGAAVVTMGIIALPAMLKRGYDPKIAIGAIMAGGTLGILIPPSILAIIYAVVAQQSVGELYLGSLLPGLLLSGLYAGYVALRAGINPKLGPAMPKEERGDLKQRLRLLRNMLAPIVLVFLVLGVIFTGLATPVEAAGVGTFGALVVAAMHGRLTWINVHDACVMTLKATGMVLWIIFGATVFVGFYILQGGQEFVQDLIAGTGLGPYGILILIMFVLVILGMFLDWVGILLLAVPIFVPLIAGLAFEGVFGLPGVPAEKVALWFGVLYLVNMQMSFLSPPFGYALFYMRGVTPPEISMGTIFKSSLPFLALQTLGLTLCILFPGLILWLPGLAYG
ncbi:MAG: TRAP transporter large permease subunit [Chromatiales bacterium]|jgi:tripartite ATP-independent transporter DctM subunit|nr:TRAP transporter large permease subunit [Chromatiales bacterium]MDX9766312.1 TRAP transporter large permease subunit [Ectothiorhodospiraceae bacterium]